MTSFDSTLGGLVVFIVAVLPGFVAQEARYSLVPRPLRPQTNLSEAGSLILSSFWIHLVLLLCLRLILIFTPSYAAVLSGDFLHKALGTFFWERKYLLATYAVVSICASYPFGLLQGWLRINRPIRTTNWTETLLGWFGITSLLDDDPVWYHVLRQSSIRENVFLEVRMKDGQGYYAGLLKTYGILDDSAKSKDFYLIDVYFKAAADDEYRPLEGEGMLLNFQDVLSIQIAKRVEPSRPTEEIS